jgi:hypothetical protein
VERDNWVEALRFADAAIEIVQRTGERAALPYSLRALALARLGRKAEARESLARSSNNRYAARACFALGLDEVGNQVLQRAEALAETQTEERIPHEAEILQAIEKLRRVQEERKKRYLIS